jgi:hypothetical protein
MWVSQDFEERAALHPGEQRTALTGPCGSPADADGRKKQSTIQTVRWHRCNPIGFSTQVTVDWFHGFLPERLRLRRIAGTGMPVAAYHLRGGLRVDLRNVKYGVPEICFANEEGTTTGPSTSFGPGMGQTSLRMTRLFVF